MNLTNKDISLILGLANCIIWNFFLFFKVIISALICTVNVYKKLHKELKTIYYNIIDLKVILENHDNKNLIMIM